MISEQKWRFFVKSAHFCKFRHGRGDCDGILQLTSEMNRTMVTVFKMVTSISFWVRLQRLRAELACRYWQSLRARLRLGLMLRLMLMLMLMGRIIESGSMAGLITHVR